MKYIAIRMKSRDIYVQHLEKLSNEGGRVISAGMAENSPCSCFEWWAIVEKQDEAQQTPEAPKNEAAELLEAARKLADYCERQNGTCWDATGWKCPLFSESMMRCRAACIGRNDSAPRYWVIRKEDDNV